jgi:hypothetical protein
VLSFLTVLVGHTSRCCPFPTEFSPFDLDLARSTDCFKMAPLPSYKKPVPKNVSRLPSHQAGPSSKPEEETFNTTGPKSRVDHSYINTAGDPNKKFKRPRFTTSGRSSEPTRSTNIAGPSSIGHEGSRSSLKTSARDLRTSVPFPLLAAASSDSHGRPSISTSQDTASLADEDFLAVAERIDPVCPVAIDPVSHLEEDDCESPLSSVDPSI